ncbi:MAG: hypothetical protein WDW38_001636 [Sanguina aurantia]
MAAVTWPLAAIYCSEAVGTLCALTLANGVVANQVLPTSKGHHLGWGWMSYIFGYSFSLAILAFGGVSAYLNPAVAMGAWILGDVTTAQFFVILAGTLTGGFLSGLLVYLLYFNQFQVSGAYRRKYESSIADMTTTQTLESAGQKHGAGSHSCTRSQVPAVCMPALSSDPEQGLSQRGAGEPSESPPATNGSPDGMKHRSSNLSSGSSKDLSNGPGPKLDYRKENPYLTIFATHPAIRSPLINYLSEAFMTFFFVLFVNLIHRQVAASYMELS